MATEKRLIDANALDEKCRRQMADEWNKRVAPVSWAEAYKEFLDDIWDATTIDAIPIAVMKRAIEGINAADQADQAGLYSYRLRDALRTVLEWYGCPAYKEHERRCK